MKNNLLMKVIKERFRKFKIAFWRISAKIELFFVMAFFTVLCACLAYYVMACVVWCLETGRIRDAFKFLKFWECWESIKLWYEINNFQTKGYVPTIVGASASLLITMTTIIQAHFNRAQDRVIGFPRNCIDEISVGMHVRSNVNKIRKYFDPVEAETVVEFGFKEGFSTYYKAKPFRLFVCLIGKRKKDKKWEALPIYNFQYSNLLDDNPNDYEILIETCYSELLHEYCQKPEKNDDYRLKIILDIQWKNNLIPKWRRMLGDMYIREEIDVAGVQKNKKNSKMKFSYKYDVSFTEHRKAYLASWILIGKSSLTSWRQKAKREKSKKYDRCLKERQRAQDEYGA